MIAIPIILSILITYVLTRKYLLKIYYNTIAYNNDLINKYITENNALRKTPTMEQGKTYQYFASKEGIEKYNN